MASTHDGERMQGGGVATESYDPSYYDVLGVPEDADGATIRKAFARGMREAHPDQHAGDEAAQRAAAEKRARLLTEARSILTGPDRQGYDERLRLHRGSAPAPSPVTPAPPPSGGTSRGADQESVLPLTRERWERGGTLVPNNGGRPIVVPARPAHGSVLTFEGRGGPGRNGSPAGDLHVRVVHVDSDGDELPEGHAAASRASALGRVVRGLSPVEAGVAGVVVFVAVVFVAVLALT
ncbi:DnaJ domain-containing protein [Phycicoccus sp. CSK15P-2]|uniref:J domain-containing protein n=1 Tax=Phycicoccus sp. CSK15P-2 TaxID=2807627 RepID=UPI0019524E67|nr:J domain-containing protein [Phycicoccus sp. CSK15P-2]MBM6405660.1 DnaJ domain-containing protein [Phycicoccus sp. CSK15P-2]